MYVVHTYTRACHYASVRTTHIYVVILMNAKKIFFINIWPIHFFVVYLFCDSKKGIRRL